MGALAIRGPSAPSVGDATRALACGLQRIGWEIREVDIDTVAGRAVVRLHRFDGRWLHLAADDIGRASLERWQRDAIVYRYRGGPQCDGHEDRFLGRSRHEGLRSGLRSLCTYIADNPAPGFPSLTSADVRRLVAPLLTLNPE